MRITLLILCLTFSAIHHADESVSFSYPETSIKHTMARVVGHLSYYTAFCNEISDEYKYAQLILVGEAFSISEEESKLKILEITKTEDFMLGARQAKNIGCEKVKQKMEYIFKSFLFELGFSKDID